MDLKKVEQAEVQLDIARFLVSSLVQKRTQELVRGAPPLVETRSDNPITIALDEILEGRITLEKYDASQDIGDLDSLDLDDAALDDDAGLLDL